MPDIFVAQDTTGYSKYYSDVVRKSLVNKFSFRFVDNHRKEFQEFKSAGEIEKYLDSRRVLNQFYDQGKKQAGQ